MRNFLITAVLLIFCISSSAQWQKIDVSFEPLEISAVDSNILWCINNSTPKIARTSDGGSTWSLHDIPNAGDFLLRAFIDAIDASKAWVGFFDYDSSDNYLYRTLDGGLSWQEYTPDALNPVQVMDFQKFYTFDEGIILSSDYDGHVFVYRTTDGGQSWSSKMLTVNGSYLSTATYGDRHIWFYTGSGELWQSSDRGENWTIFQTPLVATSYGLAMAFADSLNGLAFKNHFFSHLYRTTDGGASWQLLSNPNFPTPSTEFIWALEKIPGLPHAWIIGYNDGTAYTLDDGDSWITERNYPDRRFRGLDFLNRRQGWGIANLYPLPDEAVFKWEGALDSDLIECLELLGPVSGEPRRVDCNKIRFQGRIRADITNDPGLHLRVQLSYPDNTHHASQKQLYHNISTGCADCTTGFVPDPGQATIGEIRFDMPVYYAFDTSQAILCTVSPTQCLEDTSNEFQFHTGYFANWFHPECFEVVDASNCIVELQTNVCGNDTNQYLIYHRVENGPLILGNQYEGNPEHPERIRFYIYAEGNIDNSTCYDVVEAYYICGTVGSSSPPESNVVSLRLAPNPASGAFHIFCDNLNGHQVNTIRIRNTAGVIVWSKALPQGASSLFVEDHSLPGGFYITELWSDGQLAAHEKLMVVK